MRELGLEQEYWLDYGCLLGAVRHQRLILWDHDLDIAVTSKAYNRLFELYRAGYKLADGFQWYYNEESQYLQIRMGDVWIDIVQYAHDLKRSVFQPVLHEYYISDPDNREEYCPPIPDKAVMPLRSAPLWDRTYPIPNDPDTYLRVVYGDYWNVRWIPFLITLLYHPIETLRFYSHFLQQKRLWKQGKHFLQLQGK